MRWMWISVGAISRVGVSLLSWRSMPYLMAHRVIGYLALTIFAMTFFIHESYANDFCRNSQKGDERHDICKTLHVVPIILDGSEIKSLPNVFDYGTDIASLEKYIAVLDAIPYEWCVEEWKSNNPNAAYCLAHYELGKAREDFLRHASSLGHPIAQNDLANMLSDATSRGDSTEIHNLIIAAANSGIPHAQVTVGWWHMTGKHGFKVDYSEAMAWNLKAYKQGHPEGANNIGQLYEMGYGVQKDIEEAKSWYKKSSVLGNVEAKQRLDGLGD